MLIDCFFYIALPPSAVISPYWSTVRTFSPGCPLGPDAGLRQASLYEDSLWGSKIYLNMKHLEAMDVEAGVAADLTAG